MDYIIKNQPMICGSYEAEIRKYKKIIGKSGNVWLYAIQDNPADNIYVSGDKNSDGFGGRTISFTLEDGTIEKLIGPWSTNADALYANTGVDLRDKYLTFVVIGRSRDTLLIKNIYKSLMIDVLYIDDKPTIGEFERGEIIAKKLANKLKKTVFCYSQSSGGSVSSPIEPEESKGDNI